MIKSIRMEESNIDIIRTPVCIIFKYIAIESSCVDETLLNHGHKQLPKKWPTVYRISKQINKKIIPTYFHRENDFWTRVNKCKNAALKHANNPTAFHNSYANYSLVSFSPPIGRGGRLVLAVKCQVCDVCSWLPESTLSY